MTGALPEPSRNPASRRIVFALLASALLAAGARWITIGVAPSPKPDQSRHIALQLLHGRGFSFLEFGHLGPTSVRPPVYPMLLSGLYGSFGEDGPRARTVALAINILCGAAATIIAYGIGRRLLESQYAALLFALCIAIWPTQLHAATYTQGLSIGLLLFLLAIWLALREEIGFGLPAGLIAGIAVLTESVLTWPMIGIVLLIGIRRPAHAILIAIAASVLVGPWVFRNTIVHDRITGVTNTFWHDAFLGNGDDATGSPHLAIRDHAGKPISQLDRLSPMEIDRLKHKSESVRSALFQEWTTAWITSHPVAYLKLCGVRLIKSLWLDWHHPLGLSVVNVIVRSIAAAGFLAATLVPFFRKERGGVDAEVNLAEPEPRRGGALAVSLVIAAGLVVASVGSMVEARHAVFMDVAQLLALASLADKKLAAS